jgi:nucleotide-binding universal stress UspA family protein
MKSTPKTPTLPEGGIVCGTDFSPPACAASDVASGIARRLGVPLTLAHAVEMPGSIASDKKAVAWLTANREKVLRQEAVRARKLGAEVVPHMESGRGDEVLVKLASDAKSRLIVVGSLGRRAPEKWLLGSVAERTAERAETPTLVLRAPERLHEWLNGTRTLEVFVCFNFTMTSEVALRRPLFIVRPPQR